ALGGEAPLKPEYLIYLKDRSGLIGAAAQPNAGQARSPQKRACPPQNRPAHYRKTGLLTTEKQACSPLTQICPPQKTGLLITTSPLPHFALRRAVTSDTSAS
ncbi:hypothetical protein, partial [Pseudomonas sp. PS01298]|uniref:hypothetical protein n=1 Tax=Pseudomonas sp. PS01298 TaxID=2991434 RepID=UPI00249B9709